MMASSNITYTLPAQTFTRTATSNRKTNLIFSAYPLFVDFYRLLKQKTDSVVPGVSKWDLLNVTVGLYHTYLPDIELETLRENICGNAAKTILFLRDSQDVLMEYQEKHASLRSSNHSQTSSLPSVPSQSNEEEEKRVSLLSSLFSDPESSDEEVGESESDRKKTERFHKSFQSFLENAAARRQQRANSYPSQEDIGVESCLVAALTYQRSTLKSKEKIFELSLLSTRRRYRCCGVGSYLLKMLKDVSLVGFYDSIVTHADSRAILFFKSCGFSDDVILNSKFRDLEEDWMNTTTMSYFPPFFAVSQTDTTDLEMEMEQWKMKSTAAHQAQAIFMNKIFQEIRTWRSQVESQKDQINSLTAKLEKAIDENNFLEKKMLLHLKKIQSPLDIMPGLKGEDYCTQTTSLR
ncbi:uncharacterized protein LOC134578468 [Pelobates fuscus]|uniref:uncharacterized protein LOC134578468 n=1 Tax=Pelobates fuscus TaxID=191477 RepID=UPI002FE4D2C7